MIRIYIRKETYNINEVMTKQIDPIGNYKRKENRVDFNGDLMKMDSHRYWTFKNSGTACVKCGLSGTYFAKEKFMGDGSYHFNLYGIDKNGEEIMLTKDHIIPKSKGGDDHIVNYQTMCYPCNQQKGNNL